MRSTGGESGDLPARVLNDDTLQQPDDSYVYQRSPCGAEEWSDPWWVSAMIAVTIRARQLGRRGLFVSDALVIREARDNELDIVASLVVDAYSEFAAKMAPDAWSSFAQDIANVRGRSIDAQVLVAERDDRIVGTVTRYPDWRGAQEDASAVRVLAVPPAQRGTGVGRALMKRCIDLARSEGKRRVVVAVAQEMEEARDLYDKLGFERATDLDHMPAPGVHMTGYALTLD
jgi:GNAT superfamily N-acetyltransferase